MTDHKSCVVIKKWNPVLSWSYNVANDICAICTQDLIEPCK